MITWWLAWALAAEVPVPVAEIPMEGSAWRMSEPFSPSRSGHALHVFSDRTDCARAGVTGEAMEACLPWVDAARGELHVAFDVRAGDQRLPVALDADAVSLALAAQGGRIPVPAGSVRIVPHEAAGYGQLFVLLIDRSSSMYEAGPQERPAMERVVGTLLSDAVLRTFFPEGPNVRTGVLVLTFTDAVRGVNGQPWQDVEILRNGRDYREAVDQLLFVPPPQYTHLYDAVETVVDGVLVDPEVAGFARVTMAPPAVVVLTDGFNDPSAAHTCGQNAPLLSELLGVVRRARASVGRPGPEVHAVGFGRKVRPDFEVPPFELGTITPSLLCGEDADRRIDGALEREGIDNVSLQLLAKEGGGGVYVGQDARDLAGFLAGRVRRLHRWFEVYARLDGAARPEFRQRFRRPMDLVLDLRRPLRAEAHWTFFPHPWFDAAPAAVLDQDPWSRRGSVWRATSLVVAWLGALWTLVAVALGLFHARRAVLRRPRTTDRRAP